jgi:hypothetical protein
VVEGRKRGYFFVGIDEEDCQLLGLLAEMVIEGVFLKAPGFAAQAFYAVTVYGAGKVAGSGAKAYLNGIFIRRELYRHIDHAVWKNRKRFSVPKKRFNQFSAF